MSLTAFSTATSLLPQSHFHPLPSCPPLPQRRTAILDILKNPFKSRRRRAILDPSSPDFRKAKNVQKAQQEKQRSQLPKERSLAPGSIFDKTTDPPDDEEMGVIRDPNAMAAALDPTPRARERWQRKMVIREVRRRGRMSRTEKLARTERSHLSKSEFFKTSVKKLFPLANQIAGKPLSEAMVQMRFSKKKAAQDVLRHLEYARDEAIVMRGMGLGKVRAQAGLRKGEREGEKEQEQEQERDQEQKVKEDEERLLVEDKKGKKRVVTDRSAMYVDEAWVGRGPYGVGFDYRARGNVNRLMLPYTSISVVLKEEATRIRQAADRESKRLKKKVWVPLPDRPITAQRQYPLW
ncbi:54S ribosomal protein L22, mitochondrial [Imshaugia aleurites]|uniref:54S ribosomal protein L22, mitochondrial n=1 Tax=Imshaugia aleurites TaxID=172621 RepID=A0A8H3IHK9_9LECA|nr:54S ribosomal protein L22, mitochondrial [Imshaugia aleurites]